MANYRIKITAQYTSDLSEIEYFLDMVETVFTLENTFTLVQPLGKTPGPLAVECYNQMIETVQLFGRRGNIEVSLYSDYNKLMHTNL